MKRLRIPTGAVEKQQLSLSHPSAMMDNMESTSVRFAGAARDLGRAARLCGLTPPAFTSPPRLAGVSRTIRRRPNGVTIAIVLRGRPWAAVLADMIDGIVAANELSPTDADRVRMALWLAVATPVEVDVVAA